MQDVSDRGTCEPGEGDGTPLYFLLNFSVNLNLVLESLFIKKISGAK